MVAQKFEALVAADTALPLERGNMGQRTLKQIGVGEAISDGGFQRGRRRRLAAGLARLVGATFCFAGSAVRFAREGACEFPPSGLAAHLTILNSRFHRIDHGQRQTCQARSPSATEKKMICARPIRFWNGT